MWINDTIPVSVVEPSAGPACGTVLLYHGLGSSRADLGKEIGCLARGGLRVVAVDAPGHGERRWPDLEARLEGDAAPMLLSVVSEAAREVPCVLDFLQGWAPDAPRRFAVLGISMGAFIAFAALGREPRLRAAVPVLGSPDWGSVLKHEPDDETRRLLEQSPHRHPGRFEGKALLALNAGRDVHVPPAPARHFVEQLRGCFPHAVERYQHVLYPESGHFMRAQDWEDVLVRSVGWLTRVFDQPGAQDREPDPA